MPLESKNFRHLQAAMGYCELGMFVEANNELEEIDAEVRHSPEILTARLFIYRELKQWELMKVVAKRLVKYDPDNIDAIVSLAYATRRADSLLAAKAILLEALPRHTEVAVFHFNLACYECILGNMNAAREFLEKCFILDQDYKLIALDDEDLNALWPEVTISDY